MDHFAGLDVSVRETSVCIVDETGKIVREVGQPANRRLCCRFWGTPSTASTGLDRKPGRCRNGFSVLWQKQACRWSVLRRGI